MVLIFTFKKSKHFMFICEDCLYMQEP